MNPVVIPNYGRYVSFVDTEGSRLSLLEPIFGLSPTAKSKMKGTDMNNHTITIESFVGAPLEKVWLCWTEPTHITRWNFASDDWCCPSAENDLTPGGRYRARMEAKDGSFGFDFEAIYDEVSALEALIYTMTDGRKVKTVFEPQKGSTKVTTTFEAEQENSVEMQRQGWQAILNNFKTYVEADTESAEGGSK